ncbi:MAG: TIGR00645 family protein [Rhodobacteraceae bacterium]|nr:TIGR00645 family protein [Paracoccaceae bacterium]
MERLIERGLFASRWLLAPMYVGLVIALAVLLVVFARESLGFILRASSLSIEDTILGILSLVDLVLLANLVLIVIFSGYENFVSKFDIDAGDDRPEWQGTVDFATLKLKLVASIVAISGIHLLKVFMDVEKYSPTQINYFIVIHVVFVVSGVLLALMDLLATSTKAAKGKS